LWIEQQVDIVLRKPVCFARTGRGAIDIQHGELIGSFLLV